MSENGHTETLFSANGLMLGFGGVLAVNDVSFEVKTGEVFSIIGPNGAGKTSVLNLISRLYDVQGSGRMYLGGNDVTRIPPHDTARRGIARTFQNTELFEHETVLKNLLIGRHVHRRTNLLQEMLFTPAVRRQELAFREWVEKIIDILDLQHYRNQVIGGPPYGMRKMVQVEENNHDLGATIIMVEHDMNLINRVSSRVMAMADGAVLASGTPAEVQSHPDVQHAYLGG